MTTVGTNDCKVREHETNLFQGVGSSQSTIHAWSNAEINIEICSGSAVSHQLCFNMSLTSKSIQDKLHSMTARNPRRGHDDDAENSLDPYVRALHIWNMQQFEHAS